MKDYINFLEDDDGGKLERHFSLGRKTKSGQGGQQLLGVVVLLHMYHHMLMGL